MNANIELTATIFDLTMAIVFGFAVLCIALLMTPEDNPDPEKLPGYKRRIYLVGSVAALSGIALLLFLRSTLAPLMD